MTDPRDTPSTDPPPLEGDITRRFKIVERDMREMRSERDQLKGALNVIRALLAVVVAVATLILSGTAWLVLTTVENTGRVQQLERRVDRIEARP